ncbi:N-acetylneuraminate (7)9-O-acetyltransferase-like, partial [Saccoglossus kowalevskii]|uniref:CAS1 domain-containing protein 1-like n=1 Tax=Saccoglossus kowalevskii TaxID=10224 RepID=A0ABM0MDB8_SACKO
MAPGGPNDSILAHCNVNTAKYVAFLLGFILVLSHGVRYYLEEHDNCNVLLEDGYHLTYSDWQPRGCMMHKYTNREAQYCMKDKHIMLLGDSRVRQLFFEGARTLSDRQVKEAKYHENLSHQDASGIKL